LSGEHSPGDLDVLRERLAACMWDDVGILRNAEGLRRALATLADLERTLAATGIADGDRAYNLAWQDWQNLASLIAVSKVIAIWPKASRWNTSRSSSGNPISSWMK